MIDFESLDNEAKYWFLGLFVTSGHFNGQNSVVFNQQRCDRDILEKICRLLAIPQARLEDNEIDGQECTRLRIGTAQCPSLIEYLKKQGVHSNSFDVPPGAARHFIRGIIDGDGEIRGEHVLKVNISGCEDFIVYVASLMKVIDPTYKVRVYNVQSEKTDRTHTTLYYVELTGNEAERFLLRLYDCTEYYGQRKFQSFLTAKSQQNIKIETYRAWVECKGTNQPIEGVRIVEGKAFTDNRGYLTECYRCDDDVVPTHLVYTSLTHPGIRRGPHAHCTQTDIFTFGVAGMYKIWLLDDRESSPTYKNIQILYGGRNHWLRVSVPPGVIHAYQNISDEDGLSINCVSRLFGGFDKKYPVDEIRLDDTEFAEFLFKL